MRTSLQGIASKARRDKKHRFRNLYGMLNKRFLIESYYGLNRRSSTGVDRISTREYGEELENNIRDLVERLKRKRYHAKLVRRTYIPKAPDKLRPLGIPATEDKALQNGACRILNAIFEQDFLPFSFGYRPKIGAKEAVQDVTSSLYWGRFSYIVDADIKGFFDNIDHDWLIKMLEQRIDDRAFIGLIKKWLKAGILHTDGMVEHPVTGSPQGGIVSPVLANVYLHYVLDIWFEKVVKPLCRGEAYLCRYADDFVVAFRYRSDVDRFYNALRGRLNKFGLELSEAKTKIIHFTRFRKEHGAYFEFLGFEFRWGTDAKGRDTIKRRTSRKKLKGSIMKFKNWCRESRNFRLRKLFSLLNAKLRGYYYYYGIIGNYASLAEFFYHVKRILYKWLNRRSQRKSFNFKAFTEILKHYRIEKPRITQKRTNQLEFKWS